MSRLLGTARCFEACLRNSLRSRHLHASLPRLQGDDKILDKVKSDLKEAMRAKDSFKSTVLRGILSDHQYALKAGGNNKVTLPSILQKAIAKRQDSSRQFRAASRVDLAEKEDQEASLIQALLPEQMSTQELEEIVKEAISTLQKSGVAGKKMVGEVMKAVVAKVDNSKAPGSLISEVVRRLAPKE